NGGNVPSPATIIPVINHWIGEYPVARLNRLPEAQRDTPIGFINDANMFRAVWQAFKPKDEPPKLDFDHNMVIFIRNVRFFNRTRILKVVLTDGIADIVAMETRSALPIEDKMAMALAEIPKKGVRAVRTKKHLIPVRLDPSNISYRIDGKEVDLINGRSEKEAAPGSVSKITTAVLGNPAVGDLNDDGRQDAALILFQNSGGTGTFIYAAAAINRNDGYHGTNAEFLGDRITVDRVSIRNGVIVVEYRDRRSNEPMAAKPSVPRSAYFIFQNGELQNIGTSEEQGQLFEGWVTVGHEARAFRPCGQTEDLWITGDSIGYNDLMEAYRNLADDREPYAPVFMVIYGIQIEAPMDGFGADYPGGFFASRLVRVPPKGNCKAGMILVDSPAPGSKIVSPLTVSGKARNTWFFEGDFPMVIIDANGSVIGQSYCSAQDSWMTKELVAFEGKITFEQPASSGKAVLLLKKDNPTGKPEYDDALEIPVFIR
ncbi:MAG: Gmad2 immunoglobulin-like domain-containing protein, partial [Desulfobacterales bacterium]